MLDINLYEVVTKTKLSTPLLRRSLTTYSFNGCLEEKSRHKNYTELKITKKFFKSVYGVYSDYKQKRGEALTSGKSRKVIAKVESMKLDATKF